MKSTIKRSIRKSTAVVLLFVIGITVALAIAAIGAFSPPEAPNKEILSIANTGSNI